MDYRIFILSKNDLKLIIFGAVIGGICQVISYKYLKNHPELLNNQNPVNETKNPVSETKNRGFRTFFPRGGVLFEVSGAKVVINLVGVINFFSKKGRLTGIIIAGSSVIIKNAVSTVLGRVLHNASPTTHSEWGKLEKTKFFIVDGKKST